MKTITVLVVVALAIGMATGARAFDNKRKGFVLGFGFGPGYISANHTAGSIETDESNGGMTTNFKIGAGLSDQSAPVLRRAGDVVQFRRRYRPQE